jgi:hypothetical protein
MIAARVFAGAASAACLALALAWPARVTADDAALPQEELRRDIYVAIALAGYHCGAISTVVQDGPLEYSVACRNGKQFRIYSVEDRVHIVDRTPGVAAAPPAREDHDALIARSLFAIVNLSGHDCDRVVRVQREPQLRYRIWCGNGTRYRISLTADERVAVEELR